MKTRAQRRREKRRKKRKEKEKKQFLEWFTPLITESIIQHSLTSPDCGEFELKYGDYEFYCSKCGSLIGGFINAEVPKEDN